LLPAAPGRIIRFDEVSQFPNRLEALTMKMRVAGFVTLLAVGLSAAIVSAAAKDPKEAACPVSGKNCNPEKHVAFDGGNVYFCCGNCQKAFETDSAKFAAKAHQQQVSTGQLVQKGCPFSGGPVKPGTHISFDGVEVGFCCPNCKAKVEKAAPEEQVTMVFGNVEKGFAPAAK
jgi:YHS domain-containing protein